MGGGESGEGLLVLRANGEHIAGVAGVEITRQVDEVRDGDQAIVVEITFLPGDAAGIEMRREIDEVRNRNSAIEIEITDAGGTDEDHLLAVRVGQLGQAEGGAGMGSEAGIKDTIAGIC